MCKSLKTALKFEAHLVDWIISEVVIETEVNKQIKKQTNKPLNLSYFFKTIRTQVKKNSKALYVPMLLSLN